MTPSTKENHYVPQFYLRRWSPDGHRVYLYETLVPSETVPPWRLKYVRGVAVIQHLYTSVLADGIETDEFERWIKQEFEDPAADALAKLDRGEQLRGSDWEHLVRFTAAQDVRTPTAYIESRRRWLKTFPNLMASTMSWAKGQLERAERTGRRVRPRTRKRAIAMETLPLSVRVERTAEGEARIHAEIQIGRELWLSQQRLLLTETIRELVKHRWRIVRPAPGWRWFTTDHPVLRLNYGRGTYSFEGGWGSRGTELMMPLSPNALLYTKIGERETSEVTLGRNLTFQLQELMAKRAARAIYALAPDRHVTWWCPRRVDRDLFQKERQAWAEFHASQQT